MKKIFILGLLLFAISLSATFQNIEGALQHVPKFGGTIYFVSKAGSDANDGLEPDQAKVTIQAALDACSAGDAVTVMAGTYDENVTMGTTAVELWCEIGTIIDPTANDAVSVTANYCKITGNLVITPATSKSGLKVTSTSGVFDNITVSGGDLNFEITGASNRFIDCIGAVASETSFDIQANSQVLLGCSTAGIGTSTTGYKVSNSADYCVFENLTSVGHGTAGYSFATTCASSVILYCSSGADDGRWVDTDDANVWSGFEFDNDLYSTSTLTAAGGVGGTGTVYNLYLVTGAVRIFNISGHVETEVQDPGATTLNLELGATAQIDLTLAGGDIGGAPVGTTFVRNSVAGDAMTITFPVATPVLLENANYRDPSNPITIVAENGTATYIELHLGDNPTSGAIHWHIEWEPVTDDGMIVGQ